MQKLDMEAIIVLNANRGTAVREITSLLFHRLQVYLSEIVRS